MGISSWSMDVKELLFIKHCFFADSEQQEIYHAARTIQHAFRKHKMQVFLYFVYLYTLHTHVIDLNVNFLL